MEFTVARRFHELILVSTSIWSSLTLWQKGQGQKLSKKNDHPQLFDPLPIPKRDYFNSSFILYFSFNLLSRASKSPFLIRLHKIPAQTPMKNTGSLEIGWAVASQ